MKSTVLANLSVEEIQSLAGQIAEFTKKPNGSNRIGINHVLEGISKILGQPNWATAKSVLPVSVKKMNDPSLIGPETWTYTEEERTHMHRAELELCPLCGEAHGNIGEQIEDAVDDLYAYRNMTCNSCGSTWVEQFDLSRVQIINNNAPSGKMKDSSVQERKLTPGFFLDENDMRQKMKDFLIQEFRNSEHLNVEEVLSVQYEADKDFDFMLESQSRASLLVSFYGYQLNEDGNISEEHFYEEDCEEFINTQVFGVDVSADFTDETGVEVDFMNATRVIIYIDGYSKTRYGKELPIWMRRIK